MDLRCTCLILAGVLVLLGGPVPVRLCHPLGDLGRGEEGELLDGSARPVLRVLGLQHLRAYTSRHQDSGRYASFSLLYKQKGAFDEFTILACTSSSGTSSVAIFRGPDFLRRLERGLLGDCGSDSGGLTGAMTCSALLIATKAPPPPSSAQKTEGFPQTVMVNLCDSLNTKADVTRSRCRSLVEWRRGLDLGEGERGD